MDKSAESNKDSQDPKFLNKIGNKLAEDEEVGAKGGSLNKVKISS